MDHLTAIGLIETGQVNGVEAGDILITNAWQQLIDDGTVWHLPALYGQAAQQMIDTNVCLSAPRLNPTLLN